MELQQAAMAPALLPRQEPQLNDRRAPVAVLPDARLPALPGLRPLARPVQRLAVLRLARRLVRQPIARLAAVRLAPRPALQPAALPGGRPLQQRAEQRLFEPGPAVRPVARLIAGRPSPRQVLWPATVPLAQPSAPPAFARPVVARPSPQPRARPALLLSPLPTEPLSLLPVAPQVARRGEPSLVLPARLPGALPVRRLFVRLALQPDGLPLPLLFARLLARPVAPPVLLHGEQLLQRPSRASCSAALCAASCAACCAASSAAWRAAASAASRAFCSAASRAAASPASRAALSAASRAACWAASRAACCAANSSLRAASAARPARPNAASPPRVPHPPGFEFRPDVQLRLTAVPAPALLQWPAARATAPFPGSAPATPKSHDTWRRANWPRNRVSPHLPASHSGRTADHDQSSLTPGPSAVAPDFPHTSGLYLGFYAAEGQDGLTKTEDILTRNPSRSLLTDQ